MGHEWKIGDWAEANGNRYFVYRVVGGSVFGVMESGTPSWDIACTAKHLPECTGWEWEPSKPVEPTARKWEFGDWAHSPEGIVRFFFEKDGGGLCVSKDGRSHCFQFRYLEYLPDCTGFDWNDPVWNPINPIEPPKGYRLMSDDETIVLGDMFWQGGVWNETGIFFSKITVKEAKGKYTRYCAAYARKIEPRYRPFANAAEFKPHRDKWLVDKDGDQCRIETISGDGSKIATPYGGISFGDAFNRYKFEDGTPFGVLDTKE